MYDPLTHPLPTKEELDELQSAIDTANETMAKMHRNHPNIQITPFVNYSQGEYAEFHADVRHVLRKM